MSHLRAQRESTEIVMLGSGGARLGWTIEAQNDAEGTVLLRIYRIYPRYLVLAELLYSIFFSIFPLRKIRTVCMEVDVQLFCHGEQGIKSYE